MVIEREIDGKKYYFELTNEEREKAFSELEHIHDISEVLCYFEHCEQEIVDTDLINDIAYKFREYLNETYDNNWYWDMEAAVMCFVV